MSLKNLGQNRGPLVRTLFMIFYLRDEDSVTGVFVSEVLAPTGF